MFAISKQWLNDHLLSKRVKTKHEIGFEDTAVQNRAAVGKYDNEWRRKKLEETAFDEGWNDDLPVKTSRGHSGKFYPSVGTQIVEGIEKAQDITLDALDIGIAGFDAGLSKAASTLTNGIDFIIGQPITEIGKSLGKDWSNNIFSLEAKVGNELHEADMREYEKLTKGNKIGKTYGDTVMAITYAAPQLLAAYLTAGGSITPEALSKTAASAQGLNTMGDKAMNVVGDMLKDPNYHMAYLQEAGDNYREAKEWTDNDDVARAYAALTAGINAAIEVGLDGKSGIQGMHEGKTLAQTALPEGGEEVLQGIVSRGIGKTMGSKAPLLSTRDERAVFNPKTSLKEGALGAAVGTFYSGTNLAVEKFGKAGYNKAASLDEQISDYQNEYDKVRESVQNDENGKIFEQQFDDDLQDIQEDSRSEEILNQENSEAWEEPWTGEGESHTVGRIIKETPRQTTFINPAGTTVIVPKQHPNTIPQIIEGRLSSSNVGFAIEGKVGDYIYNNTDSDVISVGKNVKNGQGERIGDIDVETDVYLIEAKKSIKQVKLWQLEKYIDQSSLNYFNYGQKPVIVYIDDPIDMTNPRNRQLLNTLRELGIIVTNGLEELGGIIK